MTAGPRRRPAGRRVARRASRAMCAGACAAAEGRPMAGVRRRVSSGLARLNAMAAPPCRAFAHTAPEDTMPGAARPGVRRTAAPIIPPCLLRRSNGRTRARERPPATLWARAHAAARPSPLVVHGRPAPGMRRHGGLGGRRPLKGNGVLPAAAPGRAVTVVHLGVKGRQHACIGSQKAVQAQGDRAQGRTAALQNGRGRRRETRGVFVKAAGSRRRAAGGKASWHRLIALTRPRTA